jgi:hypothetical protein
MEKSDNSIPPGEFEVEKILDYRKISKMDENTKKLYVVEEYLIKWLGYDEITWEPLSNLDNCKELLNEFKKKMKKKIPSKSINKNTKSKNPLKINKNANKVSKEKFTEISKITKNCIKTKKPKKMKNPKKKYLQQNKSYDNIKTKSEKINLKQEFQRAKNKDKNDKNKANISESKINNSNVKYLDKNRYVLYRCEIVKKSIIIDTNNSNPSKKSIYDKIIFNEIFPDDKFAKIENNIGKKRKRNNNPEILIPKEVNNNFTSPRAIKKLK